MKISKMNHSRHVLCMYVYVCAKLSAQVNYSMLLQNTYHLSDLITGFPGHSHGRGNSEVSIRELVPLPIFILLTTEIEPKLLLKGWIFQSLSCSFPISTHESSTMRHCAVSAIRGHRCCTMC